MSVGAETVNMLAWTSLGSISHMGNDGRCQITIKQRGKRDCQHAMSAGKGARDGG